MFFKFLPIFISALLLCSCSVHQNNLKPDDLLLPNDAKLESPDTLTPAESRYDLELLTYAFENGYGGRKFIPRAQNKNTIDQLRLLADLPPTNSKQLCKKIAEIFLQITDFHLSARLNGNRCSTIEDNRIRKGNVGQNLSAATAKPWAITHITIKKKKIPVISITSFPKHEDKAWDGFLDAILKAKKEAKAIVIDLRGNGGGDDTMGRNMASYFYGQDFLSPVESQVKSQTPETLAMLINNYKLRILRLKAKSEVVPDFWYRRLSEATAKYNDSKAQKIPPELESFNTEGKQFDAKKAFTKPIYILIDSECQSSCESTVEAFEMHPYAITVGENTGGFIHFGNLGVVILPYSKINIQMATDFWKFKDGRFVEGVGYAPKIATPPGTDALDLVKRNLTQLL